MFRSVEGTVKTVVTQCHYKRPVPVLVVGPGQAQSVLLLAPLAILANTRESDDNWNLPHQLNFSL